MSEDAAVQPFDTPYSISKFTGELYVKYYAEIQNVPAVTARIFNTYGPGEAPGKYRNVIPNFINKALNGENIDITGDGTETRDFTYIEDTVDLLLKLGGSPYNKGEIFNGGTGNPVRIIDLATKIIELTNSTARINYVPKRFWDSVINRCADVKKSNLLLQYYPTTPLDHGLIKTIEWIIKWRILNGCNGLSNQVDQ